MAEDTAAYIEKCDQCLRHKAVRDRAALVNINTMQPLEMLCIDFLSLEPAKGGVENILVVTDLFTRYAQTFPTRNLTAKTTALILFESATIKHLCQLAGVKKSRTTPYHPMWNGQVVRFNRTLLDMLGTLEPSEKQDWKKYVPVLTHAFNATRQSRPFNHRSGVIRDSP